MVPNQLLPLVEPCQACCSLSQGLSVACAERAAGSARVLRILLCCLCLGVLLQHELDLLVASTPDGRLVLADCFCLDTHVSPRGGGVLCHETKLNTTPVTNTPRRGVVSTLVRGFGVGICCGRARVLTCRALQKCSCAASYAPIKYYTYPGGSLGRGCA